MYSILQYVELFRGKVKVRFIFYYMLLNIVFMINIVKHNNIFENHREDTIQQSMCL